MLTCFYAFRILCRLSEPGVTKSLRTKVLRRHFVYFGAFVVMFITFIITSLFYLEDVKEEDSKRTEFNKYGDKHLYKPAYILYFCMSIVIMLNRLLEPYVMQTLKENLNIKNSKNKHKYADESLDSFLNSALNVDYVYLILCSVT